MSFYQKIIVPLIMLCFITPYTVFAGEEKPSFTSLAQAQHAENIAEASFSDSDWEEAEERAKTAYAEDMAEALIEQKAQDYAEGVFEQEAEEYAENFVIQKSMDHADSVVDADDKATRYANSEAEEGTDAWDEKYQYALDRLRSSDEWIKANSDAYQRSTGEGYKNLKMTTYENWMTDPENAYVKEKAYEDAQKRAYGDFGPGHQNAYQTALQKFYGEDPPPEIYEEYLTGKVSEITGERIEEIRRLRYEEKLGLGQIKKMYPVPNEVLGLGHSYKANIKIPKQKMARQAPEPLSLADEIAEVTKRNTRTGWAEEPDLISDGYKKNKNAKKYYGLRQTSGVANEIEADSISNKGKGMTSNTTRSSKSSSNKNNKNNLEVEQDSKASKSNKGGNSGNKSDKSNKSEESGKNEKSNNGNNGNQGGNGKNK